MNDLIAANRNKTPLDILDDAELVRIAKERAGEEEVEIDLSTLHRHPGRSAGPQRGTSKDPGPRHKWDGAAITL